MRLPRFKRASSYTQGKRLAPRPRFSYWWEIPRGAYNGLRFTGAHLIFVASARWRPTGRTRGRNCQQTGVLFQTFVGPDPPPMAFRFDGMSHARLQVHEDLSEMNEIPIKVRVALRREEAEDIISLELVPVDGGQLPSFGAGAHIDVEVAPGLTRQYSLCNNPLDRDRYEIGVLLEPASRGGSIALHRVPEGAELRISAPRNHFELEARAERTLLLAGGIGVTPILCMAERLSAIDADFTMHYSTRSRARCAFFDRISRSHLATRVQIHFDDGADDQKLDIAAALGDPTPGTHLYVCGPSGFINAVLTTASARGYPDAQVHREYFRADTAAMFAEGGSFEVKLASTSAVYAVPSDRTVLEVLRAHGVKVPTSCEQGVCGACLTRVLDGVPEHRDYYLTTEERSANDRFMPCCSRSRSPTLVIDL